MNKEGQYIVRLTNFVFAPHSARPLVQQMAAMGLTSRRLESAACIASCREVSFWLISHYDLISLCSASSIRMNSKSVEVLS